MAKNVMTQLIERGDVRRGRLGVTIQHITPDVAQGLGLASVNGTLVNDVEGGGPAAKAGVMRGDVITALNGQPVKDSNVLRNEIAQLQPGTAAKLTLRRDGSEREISVTLGELR